MANILAVPPTDRQLPRNALIGLIIKGDLRHEETWRDARSIERFEGMTIEWNKVEGFNYTYSGTFDGGGMPQLAVEKPKSRLTRGGQRQLGVATSSPGKHSPPASRSTGFGA